MAKLLRLRALLAALAVLLIAVGCSSSHGGADTPVATTSTTSASTTAAPTAPTTATSAGGLVPTGFTAFDLSWVGTEGWALGTEPAGCARPPCTSVIHTVDGGRTWSAVAAPRAYLSYFDEPMGGPSLCTSPIACVEGIRFANANVGYIYGASSLWLSIDGGRSWAERSMDDTVALEIEDSRVVRVVEPPGFCTGGCLLQVEAAAVGSTAWHALRVPTLAGYREALALAGSDLYLAVFEDGAPAQLYRSDDDGARWSTFPDPCGTADGQEVEATAVDAGPGGLLAVGCSTVNGAAPGFAVMSTDAGATFGRLGGEPLNAHAVAPHQERIDDIAVVTAHRLAVVATSGGSAYICVSNDTGGHWSVTETDELIPRNGTDYSDLGFQGATTGRAVIDGINLMTSDGGDTWTPFVFSGSSLPYP